MHEESILVMANVRLLPAEESGLTAPISGSYRAIHSFSDADDQAITTAFLELPDCTELHPGQSMELPILFANWPGWEDDLYEGREWRIRAGAQTVGIGTVLEVMMSPF